MTCWPTETVSEALRLFNQAIELDPDFAAAHGMAARCYLRRKIQGWMADRAKEMSEIERLARRAVELGSDDAVALYCGGYALAWAHGYLDSGAASIDRARTLNPNLAEAWNCSGWVRINLGEPEGAISTLHMRCA
jgi:tetratricopeptide (TPR) repeat protein